MNKTKIDWCDSTWNPVTGCLHKCEYCYARRMVNRFSTQSAKPNSDMHDIVKRPNTIYPFGFDPTFHRYRLDDYKTKKGRTIFVGSMTDLFGEWVPDEWIEEVFKACEEAPQHRYLFLTKNPKKYKELKYNYHENMWLGMSYTHMIDGIIPGAKQFLEVHKKNIFMSLEPILEPLHFGLVRNYIKWAILGAETGNRKGKIIPEREWIESIVDECRYAGIPVFMKSSLADIWGEELIQEYPWKV